MPALPGDTRTDEERRRAARMAANASWARSGALERKARTRPAHDAADARLTEALRAREDTGDLTEAELARKVAEARTRHFRELARLSAQARRRRQEAS